MNPNDHDFASTVNRNITLRSVIFHNTYSTFESIFLEIGKRMDLKMIITRYPFDALRFKS